MTKNFLDAITNRFEIKISDDPPPDQRPDQPCECGSKKWWRPKQSNQWKCQNCTPCPAGGLLGESITLPGGDDGDEPTVIETFIATCCGPWCGRCRGWQAIETHWSDGRVESKCKTCGAVVDDWPTIAEAIDDEVAA